VATAAEPLSVKVLASRVSGRRSPNLVAAIYGTIVATAVVAGLGERPSISPPRALWILLASGVFFWIAHVYASLLATRIQEHRRTRRADVRSAFFRDWPLFQASIPLAVPLVLGWLGILGDRTALAFATGVGVVTLVALGIGLARRENYGPAGIVACASINGAVGLFIIGLKVALR
jgi:hypothetical protein